MDINTEQMQRAANTFDNAADQMRRTVESFDHVADRLERLLGNGWGNNIERLIEQLEKVNDTPKYLITTEGGSNYVSDNITEKELKESSLGVITITDMTCVKQHDGANWVAIDKWDGE